MEDLPIRGDGLRKIESGRAGSAVFKPNIRKQSSISDSIQKAFVSKIRVETPKNTPLLPPPELVSLQDTLDPVALRKQIQEKIESQYGLGELLELLGDEISKKRTELASDAAKKEAVKILTHSILKHAISGTTEKIDDLVASELSKIAKEKGLDVLAAKIQFTALVKNNPSMKILFQIYRAEEGDSGLAMEKALKVIDDHVSAAGSVRRSFHRNPLIREAVIQMISKHLSHLDPANAKLIASGIVQANYTKTRFQEWSSVVREVPAEPRQFSVPMKAYIDYMEAASEVLNEEMGFNVEDLKSMMKRLKQQMEQLAHFKSLERMVDRKVEKNLYSLIQEMKSMVLIKSARDVRWLRPLIPSSEMISALTKVGHAGFIQVLLPLEALATAHRGSSLFDSIMTLVQHALGDDKGDILPSGLTLGLEALAIGQAANYDPSLPPQANALSSLINLVMLTDSGFIEGITKGLGKLAGFDVVQSRSVQSAVQLMVIISSSAAALSKLIEEGKKAGVKPADMARFIHSLLKKRSKLIQHWVNKMTESDMKTKLTALLNEELSFSEFASTLEKDGDMNRMLKTFIEELPKMDPEIVELIGRAAKPWLLERESLDLPTYREAA